MKHFIWIILFLVGCASQPKNISLPSPFCESRFGKGSAISWVMHGESMDGGKTVGDSITGFKCVYNPDGKMPCENSKGDNPKYCHSKIFSVKELCGSPEMSKDWGQSFADTNCKIEGTK